MDRLRLPADDRGLTLTELLIVLILFAVLIVVSVPAYASFRNRANDNVGPANIRAIAPAIEAYGSDHAGYTGMTFGGPEGIRAVYAGDVNRDVDVTILSATVTTYCVRASAGLRAYYKGGPGAEVGTDPCT